jgi:hypothetical protein
MFAQDRLEAVGEGYTRLTHLTVSWGKKPRFGCGRMVPMFALAMSGEAREHRVYVFTTPARYREAE